MRDEITRCLFHPSSFIPHPSSAVAIGANCADFVEEFENTPCRGISGFAAFLMNVRKKDAESASLR
jgi:hypothetical protein